VLSACVLSGVLHRVQEITVHSFKANLAQQSYFDLSLFCSNSIGKPGVFHILDFGIWNLD
jgi:hypothetical protein